jgi:hypothetical protein
MGELSAIFTRCKGAGTSWGVWWVEGMRGEAEMCFASPRACGKHDYSYLKQMWWWYVYMFAPSFFASSFTSMCPASRPWLRHLPCHLSHFNFRGWAVHVVSHCSCLPRAEDTPLVSCSRFRSEPTQFCLFFFPIPRDPVNQYVRSQHRSLTYGIASMGCVLTIFFSRVHISAESVCTYFWALAIPRRFLSASFPPYDNEAPDRPPPKLPTFILLALFCPAVNCLYWNSRLNFEPLLNSSHFRLPRDSFVFVVIFLRDHSLIVEPFDRLCAMTHPISSMTWILGPFGWSGNRNI